MTDLLLPRRARGRPSPDAEAAYRDQRQAFCALIQEIRSTMDFAVGVRGWCYILEGRGHITKGEFDACENFITDCRKTGDLPLDICAEDDSRGTIGLQREPDESDPRDHAQGWVNYLRNDVPSSYTPFGFWDGQKVYCEVAVEKLDLRNLFESVCAEFRVGITNLKGWSDINARAAMMDRFAAHERAGRDCVLLMCNDHDPGGLHISEFMAKNLDDLSAAVGVRKCEANALVVAPEIGRQLCRDAILRHVSADAPRRYQRRLQTARRDLRRIIDDMLPWPPKTNFHKGG